MKRVPLERRTELARGGPPRRQTGLRRNGTWVNHRPPKAVASAIRVAVYDRDGHRCRLRGSTAGPCIGGLTVHHLRKESQGGRWTMRNLLTLCQGHNGWVETERLLSVAWGLYVSPMDGGTFALADHGAAWARLQLAGIVDYWWDGTPAHRPAPDDITRP
jgi:hypothetical protein